MLSDADTNEGLPRPMGHVIGLVESEDNCGQLTNDLIHSGVSSDRIMVLHGDDGLEQFQRMMLGSSWGETAQEMTREGEEELRDGGYVVWVKADNREEGLRIATAAKTRGGHAFSYFGELADERMTR